MFWRILAASLAGIALGAMHGTSPLAVATALCFVVVALCERQGRTMTMFLVALAIGLFAVAMTKAHAAERECDTALVLAVDVSSSVDADEYRLQMDGIAAALAAPSVVRAATSGALGCSMVGLFVWGSNGDQAVVLKPTRLDDQASAELIAGTIAAAERPSGFLYTAIGSALKFGLAFMPPCRACRRVLDVSGDGPSTDGDSPVAFREIAEQDGVTINGLIILGADDHYNVGLEQHYREAVMTHDGRLWIAESFATFGEAIRSKLESEVASSGARTQHAEIRP